jgi:exonuclease VII small subunit
MGDNFHPQDNHIPMAEDNANIENGTTSIAADAEVATATIATPTLPPQAQMEDMSNEVKLDQEMASTQPPPPQAQELLHEDNVAASNVMMNDASEAAAAAAAVEGLAVETVPGTAMDENGVPIPTDFAIPTDGMINATNDAHQIHHHHHHMDHSTGALESSMPALPPTTLADPTTPAAPSTDNNMAMAMAPPITLTSPAPTRTLITPKKSSTKQERMDAIWMKHYKELQQYKVENQHVRVPRKSGPLGEWVRTQRRYYKLWRRGESVPLTKERMELLDQLGFVWLPAEEKVGGGFRGGRPKKRKREEEDALAAANAAAVAAAAAGAVAVAGGHHHMVNTAFYHNLASPALAAGATAAANATDGTLEDHVDVDMEEQVEGTMMPGGVNVDGVLPSVATPLVATSGIPYNYHHDPFYLHSISKRNDITNQIGLLEKHEPLNRPAGNGGVKEIFKTQKLTESHSHYEDVVSVLKRSNEELRDAELALDRAKKTYDQAQQLKDKADALLSSASEEVLMAELEEGDDEWIGMYKCLVKYQDHHGNILFPRISNTANNTAEEEVTDEAVSVSNTITYGTIKQESEEQPVDVAAIAAMKAEEQVVEQIDINTAPTTATPTTDEQLENLGEAPLVENPIDEAQPTAEIDGKEDEVVENNAAVVVDASDEANNETKTDGETAEAMEVDIDGSTQADTTLENSATVVDASTEQVAGDGTIEVTAADLHDWVGKMRKFPKKQLKKWRRYALNKLGFVWLVNSCVWDVCMFRRNLF